MSRVLKPAHPPDNGLRSAPEEARSADEYRRRMRAEILRLESDEDAYRARPEKGFRSYLTRLLRSIAVR